MIIIFQYFSYTRYNTVSPNIVLELYRVARFGAKHLVIKVCILLYIEKVYIERIVVCKMYLYIYTHQSLVHIVMNESVHLYLIVSI